MPAFSISCSFCIANCIRRMFLITQYLANEAFRMNTLADRKQSACGFPLFVRQLSQMCQRCILRLNLTSYSASSTVTIDFKLADIKLESSEAYLPKLEKNLSKGFEIIDIFCKNAFLNICRYLKCFYTYKKINNIFLKFDYSLLRMPKIIEIS